jgi:hypothetical protein
MSLQENYFNTVRFSCDLLYIIRSTNENHEMLFL